MIQTGQGPQNHPLLLIGSGRLARHLSYYLEQTKTPFERWSRRTHSATDLARSLSKARAAALALSDDALGDFIDRNLSGFTGTILHFSGAWHRPGIPSAHPLMSFGPDLFPAELYPSIHFTLCGLESLEEIFPRWKNPVSRIEPEQKAFYHALCVLGGNFPVLLWHKMETDLLALGVPRSSVRSYIQAVTENYLRSGSSALTGPLVRRDHSTISKNLEALSEDPWRKVYQSVKEVFDEHS